MSLDLEIKTLSIVSNLHETSCMALRRPLYRAGWRHEGMLDSPLKSILWKSLFSIYLEEQLSSVTEEKEVHC